MLYTLNHGAGFHDSAIHGQPLAMVLMHLVSHQPQGSPQASSWLLASTLRMWIHSWKSPLSLRPKVFYSLSFTLHSSHFFWCCCCCQVASVVSDSVRPHRRQPTRLPCPWDSPGKNTGVGCHFLLQCTKVKSEREVAQLCPTPSDAMDCSLPGPSIHGILQARVLEWGAIVSSTDLQIIPLHWQKKITWLTIFPSNLTPVIILSDFNICTLFPSFSVFLILLSPNCFSNPLI